MRKAKLFSFLIVFLMLGTMFGQENVQNEDWLAKKSWSFGFGFDEPQYVSTTLYVAGWKGYGAYASIQRNFSEHVGTRLLLNYGMLEGQILPGSEYIKNYSLSGSLDMLFYLLPCEDVSPYLFGGVGNTLYSVKNSPQMTDGLNLDYIINIGAGVEWHLATNWKIVTEIGFHHVGANKFDGIYGTSGGGLLGANTDSYMTWNIGANYYFGKSGKSTLCDECAGLSKGNEIDYAKIEEIVKKYQQQQTEIDYNKIAEIEKNNAGNLSVPEGKWVLVGVNFDVNKATIKSESYPILIHAAEILRTHPDVNVEIQGFTDNSGNEKYNLKLAQERADAVKEFLVAKGVESGRLSTTAVGEADPVANNKTESGRMLNRRIEFKVK